MRITYSSVWSIGLSPFTVPTAVGKEAVDAKSKRMAQKQQEDEL